MRSAGADRLRWLSASGRASPPPAGANSGASRAIACGRSGASDSGWISPTRSGSGCQRMDRAGTRVGPPPCSVTPIRDSTVSSAPGRIRRSSDSRRESCVPGWFFFWAATSFNRRGSRVRPPSHSARPVGRSASRHGPEFEHQRLAGGRHRRLEGGGGALGARGGHLAQRALAARAGCPRAARPAAVQPGARLSVSAGARSTAIWIRQRPRATAAIAAAATCPAPSRRSRLSPNPSHTPAHGRIAAAGRAPQTDRRPAVQLTDVGGEAVALAQPAARPAQRPASRPASSASAPTVQATGRGQPAGNRRARTTAATPRPTSTTPTAASGNISAAMGRW